MPDKKPPLRMLNFPKNNAQDGLGSTPGHDPEVMGFDILRLSVTSEDGNRVIEFLNAHGKELPPTPQNLLGLIWTATRSLLNQGIPYQVPTVMMQRAIEWEDEATPPGGGTSGLEKLPKSKRKKP